MLVRHLRRFAPRPLRRVPMVAWFALAAVLVFAGTDRGWLPGAAPFLPTVIYGPGTAPPPAIRFTVRAAVVDGDTLAAGAERLRLHGIDAPEARQRCERGGRPYDCGREAMAAMVRILGRGMVSCEQLDTDRYGRRVVRCHDEQGTDLGAELVRQGWAVAFRRYSLAYLPQEAAARLAGRGLWAGRFEQPAAWRERQRP